MMPRLGSKIISIAAVFTALVALTTAVFQIYIPETKGYFNMGEIVTYTTALLFGPIVGCIAGGLGSALADVMAGYYIYASATLVIKGVESFVVGYLSRKLPKLKGKALGSLTVFSLLAIFTGLWIYLYSGTFTFTLALGQYEIFTLTTLSIVVYMLAVMFFVVAAVVLYRLGELATLVVSTLTGGAVMVTGYYLYESLVLNVVALAEIPFNIGQAIIGAIGAIPLYTTLKNTLKQYQGVVLD